MAKTLLEIQQEVIDLYNIKIITNSDHWSRMHAIVKKREVHKWEPKASLQATFDLFHEIGHIMTTKSSMHRCESEYWATKWAIEKFASYGLNVPPRTMVLYQAYIYRENARGMRRGGKDYTAWLDIYKLIGRPMTKEEFGDMAGWRWKEYMA